VREWLRRLIDCYAEKPPKPYLKGKDAESEEAQKQANSSSVALY
jgi:hypothetical protein